MLSFNDRIFFPYFPYIPHQPDQVGDGCPTFAVRHRTKQTKKKKKC